MYQIHEEKGKGRKWFKAQMPGLFSELTDSEVMAEGSANSLLTRFLQSLSCVLNVGTTRVGGFALLSPFYSHKWFANSVSEGSCGIHVLFYSKAVPHTWMLTIHINRWVLSIPVFSAPTEIHVTRFWLCSTSFQDDIHVQKYCFIHPPQVPLCYTGRRKYYSITEKVQI